MPQTRRTRATTSWLVQPAGLSTSSRPSGPGGDIVHVAVRVVVHVVVRLVTEPHQLVVVGRDARGIHEGAAATGAPSVFVDDNAAAIAWLREHLPA